MTKIIRAFMEVTCKKCGGKIGWNGTILDRPACPKCKYRPTEEERKLAQERFDNIMKRAKRR